MCYFLGIIWYIIADIVAYDADEAQSKMTPEQFEKNNTDVFIHYYELEQNSP
jgi:hypothetical protein